MNGDRMCLREAVDRERFEECRLRWYEEVWAKQERNLFGATVMLLTMTFS